MALVLKTSVPQGTVGSNPTLSANNGGVAQLGERLLCKQNVAGSIPVTSTKLVYVKDSEFNVSIQ